MRTVDRGVQRRFELGVYDEPLGRVSEEIERIASNQVQHPGLSRLQDADIGRPHDLSPIDSVNKFSIGRFEIDFVTRLDLPQNSEMRVAMAGDHTVSILARLRGARHVARSQAQVAGVGPFYNIKLSSQARYGKLGYGFTELQTAMSGHSGPASMRLQPSGCLELFGRLGLPPIGIENFAGAPSQQETAADNQRRGQKLLPVFPCTHRLPAGMGNALHQTPLTLGGAIADPLRRGIRHSIASGANPPRS